MRVIYAEQDDNLDAICWRYYDQTAGIVEQVLEANPQLSEYGVIIPHGTQVFLPDVTTSSQTIETIQLWK